jgi:predicted ATPase/class 3 adenylate cyclase/DNA-binding CsgD family transcriptional regulator
MSGSDSPADPPPLNWSDLGMSGVLPTGTVTLLLADVEGSTGLWETQPQEMRVAIAMLDMTLADLTSMHNGARPVEQGEGDSFVLAFTRASDAVACALALQRAPLAPIRLRIGVNTGEIELRDEGNYIGPAINRTGRLRDLAHGGQTVLSGATESMVLDHLPADAWLTDLGTHTLRDLPRPERVVQLCHPDIPTEFPPLRVANAVVVQRFPAQLTSFVGRAAQIDEARSVVADNRLVTLNGAGGAGKTRMAIQLAGAIAGEFADGAWYVDLAPITNPDVVAVALARALGLPDQPSRSTMDTIVRFVGDRRMLVVLDNCEHLLDVTAELAVGLLKACPALTLLTTSREPIGVAGEVTLRVPSLAIADEAVQLFADRARLVRAEFHLTDDNVASVTEICRRLDGMPLAIELAAARVRALSLQEIVDSLDDRFRLLTGGSRTTVRRQQTLRASVDWSHALLTEPERVVFRQLAVFLGGFDLEAARAISGHGDVERYQVLDLLTLLVDKSLVVAVETGGRTRYRLLETVRQYAQEKLAESAQADAVRALHRDHYLGLAIAVDAPGDEGHEARLEQAEIEIDNIRAAFAWSRECGDTELALQLACSLFPLWLARGRNGEGCAWLEATLSDRTDDEWRIAPAVYARALADKVALDAWSGLPGSLDRAEEALAIARDVGDRALLARALTARGFAVGYDDDLAQPYFAEALELAREIDDSWRLIHLLGWRAYAAVMAGDPIAARMAADEGRRVADASGNHFASRTSRIWLGWADMMNANFADATARFDEVLVEVDAVNDLVWRFTSMLGQTYVFGNCGDIRKARATAEAALDVATELTGFYPGFGYGGLGLVHLAAGELDACAEASETASNLLSIQPNASGMVLYLRAEAALAGGDLTAARRFADEAVSTTKGWNLSSALRTRARVALAQRESEQAERDAYAALACAADLRAYLGVADTLECLARLAGQAESKHEAVRLLGAANAMRERGRLLRFKAYDADFENSAVALRDVLGQDDFEACWAEGAALSTEEAIAYAQRGRGERKRPSSGWASLTPTELDVVRLVGEGLANKDVAKRLFVSPRTVQTHLTHVYTKLALTSRVQLAQEANRHA